MSYLERWITWFWERAAQSVVVPSASLGIFRWVFGLEMLLFLAPHSAWVGAMPSGMFDPQIASFSYLLAGLPGRWSMLVLDSLQLLSLLALTVGYRTRLASVAFVLLAIVNDTFRFSFARLDRDFLPTTLVICMLFGNWHRYLSLDRLRSPEAPEPDPTRDRRALALLGAATAFGMFTAGLPKLINWVDFDLATSGLLSWYLPNYFELGRTHLLAPLLQHSPRLALELADYSAPLLELFGFVALLWSRRVWLIWLLVLIAFHLGNDLLLNIEFQSHVIVYLAFLNWQRLLPGIGQGDRRLGVALAGLAAMATLWHVVARLLGRGSEVVFVTGSAAVLSLWISIPVCLAAMIVIGLELRALAALRSKAVPV